MALNYHVDTDRLIAKYGADLNAMMQAALRGEDDPTGLVLAGMKVKSAQNQRALQGANPPTVAVETLGGLPPAPSAPPPPAGGLGAVPQGAPPMAPDMQAMAPAPEAPMPEAPMGMAAGGLTYAPPYTQGGLDGLPIPDTMFDENRNGGYNDGYAGGGIVAFGGGGDIDAERLRRALLLQESSGDYGAINEGSGALGGYQFMPDTARALAKRLGLAYRPELMTGKGGRSAEGKAYQERLMDAQMKDILAFSGGDVGRAGSYHFAGPNEEGWGPKTRQYQREIMQRYSGSKDAGDIPERNLSTSEGQINSLQDIVGAVQGINRKSDEELAAEKRVKARLEEKASDEGYEKQRKADMWQTLAEIGFNMASSKSPYVLQAIGEAAATSMPGARADKKDRKEAKDRALEGLMELGARSRKEAMDALQVAIPVWQAGMSAQQFEKNLALKRDELDIMRQYRADSLAIEEYKAKHPRSTTTEYMVDQYVAEFGGSPMNALAQLKKLGLIGGQSGADTGASLEALVRKAQGGGGEGESGGSVPELPPGFKLVQ